MYSENKILNMGKELEMSLQEMEEHGRWKLNLFSILLMHMEIHLQFNLTLYLDLSPFEQ